MSYTNGKWFKLQGKVKCSPFSRWMDESIMVPRSTHKHRVIKKVTASEVQSAWRAPVGRLDFWWHGPSLSLPFYWKFPIFLVTFTVSLLSACDCWPRAEGAEEKSIMFQWLHLQWQMHVPFQFSSGIVKVGQVNAPACLFTSEIKPENVECAWLSVYCWT